MNFKYQVEWEIRSEIAVKRIYFTKNYSSHAINNYTNNNNNNWNWRTVHCINRAKYELWIEFFWRVWHAIAIEKTISVIELRSHHLQINLTVNPSLWSTPQFHIQIKVNKNLLFPLCSPSVDQNQWKK